METEREISTVGIIAGYIDVAMICARIKAVFRTEPNVIVRNIPMSSEGVEGNLVCARMQFQTHGYDCELIYAYYDGQPGADDIALAEKLGDPNATQHVMLTLYGECAENVITHIIAGFGGWVLLDEADGGDATAYRVVARQT